MENINTREIQNLAHQKSAYAVIDPFYTRDKNIRPDLGVPWFYGRHEFDCYRLDQMRKAMRAAKLRVGYRGDFRQVAELAYFRCQGTLPQNLYFAASGKIRVFIDGNIIYNSIGEVNTHSIALGEYRNNAELIIEINAENGLPTISLDDGIKLKLEWSEDRINWSDAVIEYSNQKDTPPHLMKPTVKMLKPKSFLDGIYDFGCEICGHVVIRSKQLPRINVGESVAEANNRDETILEQCADMTIRGDGSWVSIFPLAFRYLRGSDFDMDNLYVEIQEQPYNYRGAFACSDESLTRIWSHSAYTLKLCMHNFLLDGIKRDRLPWVGDLAMSMMVNAYVFGDGDIVRRSLSALGRAGRRNDHLKDVVDYSLWWIISHELYQQYFGDSEYLEKEWSGITDALEYLKDCCDEQGMLRTNEEDWVFIDWVETDKITALQMLWQWAQLSASRLAERLGKDDQRQFWNNSAEQLGQTLVNTAWDPQKKLWFGIPGDKTSVYSRYAMFFSVLSGLLPETEYCSAKNSLLGTDMIAVGTPYMAGFENLALAKLGAVPDMMQRTRNYWGGMLERGATTFWEGYDPEEKGDEMWIFYRRPFGKSLCHAWSAGPAAFLPQGIIGLTPLDDGWKRFSISPQLGDLSWLAVTFPTPHGDISIVIQDNVIQMCIPDGVVCEYNNQELAGTCSVALEA